MNHRDTLSPWAVFCCSPELQNVCVNRFRNRWDAEDYARILRCKSKPKFTYEVVFDLVTTPASR